MFLVGMRKASSIIVFALISLSFFSLLSFSSKADLFTTVTVETEPSCEIDVSPGSKGDAVVQGTVTCDYYNTFIPLVVELSATSTIGTATIDKPQIVFQGSDQTEDINVTVQVPLLTSASSEYTCNITGYWEQGPTTGPVIGDTFQIIIVPFFRVTIYGELPLKEVKQGESTTFNLRVENTGNCDDKYNIGITNREELESSNLIIPKLANFEIEEEGRKNINLTVDAASDTPMGEYQIELIVTPCESANEEYPVDYEEYTLFLKVKKGSKANTILGEDLEGLLISPLFLIIIVVIVIVAIVVMARRRSTRAQRYPP
jgi:hypothetical protein